MREADVVTKIKTELQKQLPTAVIFKLQDYMTTGIPDLVVNHNRKTIWVEVKLLKAHETPSSLRKHFDKVQLATCQLLERQVHCIYVVVDEDSSELGVYSPQVISNCLRRKDLNLNIFFNSASYLDYFDPVIKRLVELVERKEEYFEA